MWLEVLTVALVAQLLVLPGEKVQFVVAALSTRFDPRIVVAAAASSFAGWTAVEVAVGEALARLLPGAVLDGLTAALFALFAVLLYRSAPPADGADSDGRPDDSAPGGRADGADSDGRPDGADSGGRAGGADSDGRPDGAGPVRAAGGPPDRGQADDGAVAVPEPPTVLGRDLPEPLGSFLPIFAMMAASEFGDKTQLVTVSLAVQYGAHPAIWAGEMLAIVPVTAANAYAFHRFAGRLDRRRVHLASAALFAFFAADAVLAAVAGVSVWERLVGAVSSALLGAG